jgi:hypothetical protein
MGDKLEIPKAKFQLSEEVTIAITNPGYTGKIVGSIYGELLPIIMGPDKANEMVGNWIGQFGFNFQSIKSKYLHLLFFDKPRLPGKIPDGMSKEEANQFRTHVFWCIEDDLMSPDEYWNKLNAEIE